MTLRSRKNRRTTVRSAPAATAVSRALTSAEAADASRRRLKAVALLCGVVLIPLSILLASLASSGTARGAEMSSSGFRQVSGSSLKWRTAGSRPAPIATVTQPVRRDEAMEAPQEVERPALFSTDEDAQPITAETAFDEPADSTAADTATVRVIHDRAVVQAQAKSGAANPLDDPFGDNQPTTAPKLLTPTPANTAPTPVPSTGAGGITLPQLPSSGDQVANAGGIFQQEPCPKLEDLKPIGSITNVIAASQGELPKECYFDESVGTPDNRAWPLTCYTWKASGLCHKPLYFEEVALERYGHSTGPFSQPIVSGAHFFATLPVLPYKMGVNAPWECMYALGYYRPGSCAPYILPGIPINARGIAAQAAATAGAIYLFP